MPTLPFRHFPSNSDLSVASYIWGRILGGKVSTGAEETPGVEGARWRSWGRFRAPARGDHGGTVAMRSDGELAAAFREGDDRAFALLYERHKRTLYAFAARMLGNGDAARDIVQDAFVKVFERRRQLNNPGSFRSWLFAIGRNQCVSYLRENRKRSPLDEVSDDAIAIAPEASARDAEEDVRLIRRAIIRLKIEYRDVLILREYQDLSYREIAEITESTESAVKSKLFKARRALHEALKPAFAGRR